MSATPPRRKLATVVIAVSSTHGSPIAMARCRCRREKSAGVTSLSHSRTSATATAADTVHSTPSRLDMSEAPGAKQDASDI